MKKRITVFFLLLFSFVQPTFAHPLDISKSTFSIQDKTLTATTYFHTYEAEKLLRSKGINLDTVEDYYKNEKIFQEYLKEHVAITNNEEVCLIGESKLIKKEAYEIISEGLGIEYGFSCNSKIDILSIKLTFFINEPLQTNRLVIYDLNKGVTNTTPIAYKVLNPSVYTYTHFLSRNTVTKLIDSDQDNIPDEEERIYKTDPQKADTDNDNYTDYEEVTLGWNPLNKEVGPGQKYREKPIETPFVMPEGIRQTQEDDYDKRYMKDTNLLDTGYGNDRLKETLKAITEASKEVTVKSFGFMFVLVVILGFIHALGPGHSKSLLVSYVLDKNRSFFQGLGFVTVFTITHLIDIVILFLVTKLLFSFYDPTAYMVYIQRISIVILFLFSVYLFVRAVRSIKTSTKANEENGKDTLRGNIILGFIAGLAPCSFGWSIFLVLFSLGKLDWILPLLGALGIGIWLCLFTVLTMVFLLKRQIYSRVPKLAYHSSLLSSSILIFLSIYFFILLF